MTGFRGVKRTEKVILECLGGIRKNSANKWIYLKMFIQKNIMNLTKDKV